MTAPELSLILPTRGRPDGLRRFCDSVVATAADASRIEVVLVADDDDPESIKFTHPALSLVVAAGPAGRTMGELNTAGLRASRGRLVMLVNDDVVVRTAGWDEAVIRAAARFADGVVLVHVDDGLMRDHLCTFPVLPRVACDIIGDVFPADYARYCIDDHVEDVFNRLRLMGESRVIYLADVLFDHLNATEVNGRREYHADAAGLARDTPRLGALAAARHAAAVRLLAHIDANRPRPPAPGAVVPRLPGRQFRADVPRVTCRVVTKDAGSRNVARCVAALRGQGAVEVIEDAAGRNIGSGDGLLVVVDEDVRLNDDAVSTLVEAWRGGAAVVAGMNLRVVLIDRVRLGGLDLDPAFREAFAWADLAARAEGRGLTVAVADARGVMMTAGETLLRRGGVSGDRAAFVARHGEANPWGEMEEMRLVQDARRLRAMGARWRRAKELMRRAWRRFRAEGVGGLWRAVTRRLSPPRGGPPG